MRHADPVQVRLAGQRSSFPLRFFSKDVRVPAGSRVLAAPGGIVELFWPSGSTVVMYGPCVGVIGSVSRGEPTFVFATLENARLELRQGDQIQLPGGAILTGDSGPFVLERVFPDILRVHNQATSSARIAFRDAVFDLDPSQVIDLPILSQGTPFIKDPNLRTLDAAGFQLEVLGDVERLVFENGVRMRARGENQIVGLGVEVSLTEGEEVGFLGLERLSERAGVEFEPLDSGQNPVEQGPVEQGSSDGDQDGGF